MKIKKIVSLILALSMVLFVFVIGAVPVFAAEKEDDVAEVAADAADIAEAGEGEAAGKVKWAPDTGHSMMSEDELSVFYQATKKYADLSASLYTFYPVQVIAWNQDSKSTTYVYLCACLNNTDYINRMLDVLGSAGSDFLKYDCMWWEIFTVELREDSSPYVSSNKIDIDDVKTLKSVPENHGEIYLVKDPSEDLLNDLTPAVKEALSGYSELTLRPIDLLGTQDLSSGKNYRFLSYGTTPDALLKSSLYIVDIHEKDDKADITSVAVFDAGEYSYILNEKRKNTDETNDSNNNESSESQNNTKATEDTNPNSQNNNDSQNNNTNSSSGANNSAKSPQTGHTDMVMMVVVLLFIAMFGACVSVKQIAKKRD